MRRSVIRSGAVAMGVLSLSGAGALAAAMPAYAATGCPATTPAATLIPGTQICEIRIGAPGGTFTFPSSLVKVSAVLVGAGASGFYESSEDAGYAGEGGKVVYIDAVDLGVPHVVVVGAGSSGGSGGDTSLDAVAAAGGATFFVLPPQGAAGAGGAGTGNVGGPGLLAEDVATDTTLFPAGPATGADLTVYGRGGDSYDGDVPDPIPATALTAPGSGGHGLVASTSDAAPGIDGIVVLRFAAQDLPAPAPEPSGPRLPDTGSDATPGLIAAGGLLAAGGLAFAVGRLRRRRTAE